MSSSPGQPRGLPDKPRSDLSPRDTPAQLSSRPSGQGSGAVARPGLAGSRMGPPWPEVGAGERCGSCRKNPELEEGKTDPLEGRVGRGGVGGQALEAFCKVRLPQRGDTHPGKDFWADGQGGASGQGAPTWETPSTRKVPGRWPGPAVNPPAQPARPPQTPLTFGSQKTPQHLTVTRVLGVTLENLCCADCKVRVSHRLLCPRLELIPGKPLAGGDNFQSMKQCI